MNLAVAFQIMSNIKNGQLRSCLAMGFKQKDLKSLIDPHKIGALANSSVPWFRVVVDGAVVDRLLARANNMDDENAIYRALCLGASARMIGELFGLTHKEVAARRKFLGIPLRKGRWRFVEAEEETRLWQHWARLTKEQGTDVRDLRSVLEVAMSMAECELSLSLCMIWCEVRRWMAEELV
nr:DUF2857 domain-containing protein [Pseudomonas gingeri]